MRFKLLFFTHVDKLMLIVAVAALGYGGFVFARGKGADVQATRTEIENAAKKVRDNIAASGKFTPKVESSGVPAVLKNTFEHPPALPDLRRWVFYPRRPVAYPVIEIQPKETRVIRVPQVALKLKEKVDEEFLRIGARWIPEEDVSEIAFTGVKVKGEAINVSFGASDESEHKFTVRVTTHQVLRPLTPEPVVVYTANEHVIIYATIRQPDAPSQTVGPAGGIVVYRKLSDAPDGEFQKVTPEAIKEVGAEQLRKIEEMYDLGRDYDAAPIDADVPSLQPLGGPGITPVKERKPTVPKGLCIFIDKTVDAGESYDYSVFAVAPGVGGRESELPAKVSVTVPADIEFYFASAFNPNQATIQVRRRNHDPDIQGTWFVQSFVVGAGEQIGGRRTISVKSRITNKGERREVDFATGAILVGIVPQAKRHIMVWKERAGTFTVAPRIVISSKIIYFDERKGRMLEKWRENAPKEAASAMPGDF